MNLPTIIVLLVVLAFVIMAIRILKMGKGGCSCDRKNQKEKGKGCAGCSVDCPFRR